MEREAVLKLKNDVTNMFVKNGADISQPNVIAAIADVASDMSLALDSDKVPAEMSEAVLEIFGARENEDVRKLLGGMAPFAGNVIGFSVDTKDYGAARAAYKAQKEEYDALYAGLEVAYSEMAKENETNIVR